MRIILLAIISVFLPFTAQAEIFTADVWADNWFKMNINGVTVAEDSVPITTERSFNAEHFTFEVQRPFTIGLIAKDFKENDTGLEYIGTPRQQMGDGGLIVQIKDDSGAIIAVSNESWKCLVTHTAPLVKSCANERNPTPGQGACTFEEKETPTGWNQVGFDDAAWPHASVFSLRDVKPKDGYDEVEWANSAKFIWGPDLEQSNTILCRLTVE